MKRTGFPPISDAFLTPLTSRPRAKSLRGSMAYLIEGGDVRPRKTVDRDRSRRFCNSPRDRRGSVAARAGVAAYRRKHAFARP
jgi:hypothetical protein